MIYSKKHRFVYMPAPKTGTTTLNSVLFEHFEAEYWDFTGIVPVRTSSNDPSTHIWPRHIIHLPKQVENYFIFATIRNPYRHTMSQFWNMCFVNKKEISMKHFHEWLENSMIGSLYNSLNLNEDYEPPTGCVKFKYDLYIDTDYKFTEQFNLLPFVIKPMMLPHFKRSIKTGLFYTKEMAELVLEKKQIDFDYFGYSHELPSDLKKPC